MHSGQFIKSSKGFTLFEVLVVLAIIATMAVVLTFGFDTALTRRKDSAADAVFKWLSAAADTAVFQSAVLGVSQQADQLTLLAFYQDDWYKLADQKAFILNEEISLQWSDELVLAREALLKNRDDQAPYLVIMPTGEIFPEGMVQISDSDQSLLASILWRAEEQFIIEWQQP